MTMASSSETAELKEVTTYFCSTAYYKGELLKDLWYDKNLANPNVTLQTGDNHNVVLHHKYGVGRQCDLVLARIPRKSSQRKRQRTTSCSTTLMQRD